MLTDFSYAITAIMIPQTVCNAPYSDVPPQVSGFVGSTTGLTPGVQTVARQAALDAIEDFSKFEKDWDGYGALPIHERVIKSAKYYITSLPDRFPCPDLTPDPNGTISMEWETREGIAHLELGKTRYSLYIKHHLGKPVLRDGASTTLGSEITSLIGAILYPQYHHRATVTEISYKYPRYV